MYVCLKKAISYTISMSLSQCQGEHRSPNLILKAVLQNHVENESHKMEIVKDITFWSHCLVLELLNLSLQDASRLFFVNTGAEAAVVYECFLSNLDTRF